MCIVKYFIPIVMDISERNIFPWFPKNIFDREGGNSAAVCYYVGTFNSSAAVLFRHCAYS